MMHLVTGEHGRRSHGPTQKIDNGVATIEGVRPASVTRGRVFDEALPHLVEQLEIEAADIPVLEALDVLELNQVFRRHGRSVRILSLTWRRWCMCCGAPRTRRWLPSSSGFEARSQPL